MKKLIMLLAAATLCLSANAFTLRSHATVAYIAQKHLTPQAKAKLDEILHGETLMEYASWPDFYRTTMLDKDGKQLQHLLAVDENYRPIDSTPHQNAYNSIKDARERLSKDRYKTDSARIADVAMIIHFMGDIHCPSHLKYADGRNKKIKTLYYQMNGKGEPKKVAFHSFYDSWATDKVYSEGFVDLTTILDVCTPEQIEAMQAGTLEDWAYDSAISCKDIFDVEDGAVIDRPYVVEKVMLVKSQIRKAGYRLAKLFNDLYK